MGPELPKIYAGSEISSHSPRLLRCAIFNRFNPDKQFAHSSEAWLHPLKVPNR